MSKKSIKTHTSPSVQIHHHKPKMCKYKVKELEVADNDSESTL